ncbi:MAG: phosphatase PAP2 family protein [Marinoscillum sp.]
MNNLQLNWKLLFLIAFLGIGSYVAIDGFIEMAESMSEDEFINLDSHAAEMALAMRTPPLTKFFHFITAFGNWQVFVSLFVVFTAGFFISNKHFKAPLIVGGLISGAGVVMYVLKDLFDRQRPSIDVLVNARLSSFPSGHSMLSVVFYGFMIFLVWRVVENRFIKWLFSLMLILLILTICWSRVYLGAHYASDVLAGMIAGIGWLCMALLGYLIVKMYKKKKLYIQ